MADSTTTTFEGVLTGSALAALAAWNRHDDALQNKLQTTKNQSTAALNQIRDNNNRGDVIRSRMPVVQDAQVGLSIAQQDEQPPVLVPTITTPGRPDLTTNLEYEVGHFHWPPKPGDYTPDGYVKRVGELTSLFSSLTYEEVRAAVQSMVQPQQPSKDQKVQISRAINALIAVLYNTNLTWQQFQTIWNSLFNGTPGSTPPIDPHHQTTTPPTISAIDPSIASVTALGTPDLVGYPYAHQNTDYASKFRIQVAAGNAPSGLTIFQVNFGTAWARNGLPYQPVVNIQTLGAQAVAAFAIANVTNGSFQVRLVQGLVANLAYDIGISVAVG